MIISRTPFRVSFCGGGSDIPSFYKKFGGCVVSCAIKKYVYIAIHPSFNKNDITLKYSQTESVNNFEDIKHKIFKAVLQEYNLKGVEITSMADIPSGTGLGSSSSFTVSLLKAIKYYKKMPCSSYSLASEACDVEIELVKSPIGKQDQFAATFGGINFIKFNKNGRVDVNPIIMAKDKMVELENNIMLFYTGITHDANSILSEQSKSVVSDSDRTASQLELCKMAKKLKAQLEKGNIDYLGRVLKESWEIKKRLSKKISNPDIDNYYKAAIEAGAAGGKLLGAGGGGFLLFYVKPNKQNKVRSALSNLSEMKFEIDYEGATIIYGK